MNSLMTGGIIAAVLAGWTQVKAFASYVSSFVVVQASLDDTTSFLVRNHLRADWRRLPSGQHIYKIKFISFVGRNYSTRVPFKLPAADSVYFKKWPLLVHDNGSELRLSYIRGTINIEEVIRHCLRTSDEALAMDTISRYRVVQCVGRDKSMMFDARDSSGSIGSNAVPASATLNDNIYVDISRDKSFMYDAALWNFNVAKVSPFEDLYYDEEVTKYIEQARQWLSRKQWYAERSIPWRRGWLLHGPGGTGKTSLARAVAQDLGIPVFQFFLSTLSDQEFIEKWNGMDVPCMALLEDFDNVFDGREPVGKTSLTFDSVLNQISGLSSHNGVFVVVTTNRIEKIDPAMGVDFKNGLSTRPGRIDTVIEVGAMNERSRGLMAHRILRDWPTLIEKAVACSEGMTPAQFQEECLQRALKQMQEDDALDQLLRERADRYMVALTRNGVTNMELQ